jgi:hypothetical protein
MSRPTETVCLMSNFISASACFQNLNERQQRALMVYLKAKELNALGGTNYTAQLGPSGTLNTAAAAYNTMADWQVRLAQLVIEQDNANSAGAAISTNIQTLMDEIKCLENFPDATLDRMDLLLTCLLGRHAAWPQVNL